MKKSPIKVFIAYARKDEALLTKLRTQLRILERTKLIEVWYDGEIDAGQDWEAAIKNALHNANIILLLISADFLNSDYAYEVEMEKALAMHEQGKAEVIPVILRNCPWKRTPFAKFQALPKDGVPASSRKWLDVDEPYHQIADGVGEIADRLQEQIPLKDEARQKQIATLPSVIQQLIKDMVTVEGGTFKMGDKEWEHTQPIHEVSLNTYQIAKYPVTQEQWQAVMGNKPSDFDGCKNCPVEKVSWDDIQDFIKKLNGKIGLDFRLPTEAEWEFAARGGIKSKGYKFAGSDNVEEVAWYRYNSNSKTHAVGGKKANELGLYDLSGNVWELCEDEWHDDYTDAPKDGSNWVRGEAKYRVLRGGSWGNVARKVRVTSRSRKHPISKSFNYGFRLAHSL